MSTVILGGKDYEVEALPFKKLRKLLPIFNRVGILTASGNFNDEAVDGMARIICDATGITQEDLDNIDIKVSELTPAFEEIAKVAGIVAVKDLGEAQAVKQ